MISCKWMRMAAAAFAVAGLAGTANAGLLPTQVSQTAEGGNYRWTYAIVLPTDMKLQSGNYFTVYDFAGYVPGGESAPAGWTLTVSPKGGTPAELLPNDDASQPNLTWTYTGDTQIGQVGLGNFWAYSQYANSATDSFTALTNRASDGLKDSNITTTDVPVQLDGPPPPPPGVPEPATLVLAGIGLPLIGLGRKLRRRRA